MRRSLLLFGLICASGCEPPPQSAKAPADHEAPAGAVARDAAPESAPQAAARETPIDLVPHTPRKREINTVLSNSFGFGGTNASLIFRRVNH